jgi:hypothetical protein
MDTPNLLAELQRDREILGGARFEDAENTPFTREEQAEIAEWVEASKEFVRNRYSLPEVQLRVIEAKLDELAAQARRSGRRDWMLGVCFVMIGVMANGLLPPDAVQHIVAMLLHGLGLHLGGGGPLGLSPGTQESRAVSRLLRRLGLEATESSRPREETAFVIPDRFFSSRESTGQVSIGRALRSPRRGRGHRDRIKRQAAAACAAHQAPAQEPTGRSRTGPPLPILCRSAVVLAAARASLSARSAFRHGSADDRFHDRQTGFRRAPVAPTAPVKGGRLRTRFSCRPLSSQLCERA